MSKFMAGDKSMQTQGNTDNQRYGDNMQSFTDPVPAEVRNAGPRAAQLLTV